MSGQDPFDAGQRDALRSTDELLDRIGARAPAPQDLDDPVVAALALMAAEIDLDAVPLESTRGALEQALLGVQRTPGAPAADPAAVDVLASPLPALTGGGPWSRDDRVRGPRHSSHRPEHAAVAMAPPRSLPRVTGSGSPGQWGSGPKGRPVRQLRPLTAVAAAVAAIVLGSGVTAAITGGRSVNPLTGLQQVVAVLTNGRTVDQQELYDTDLQRIHAATTYARQGNRSEAVRHLNRVSTQGLSDEDSKDILAQVKQVIGLLGAS